MTAVPQDVLADATSAYQSLYRALFNARHDDLDQFRREVELAQLRLRGICIRMGWSK